jgi:cob(I)alamin adenosyltransferase
MKLYTRKGDSGQTRLGSGEQVAKDHPRIAAYGEVDGLNAALGLALAACEDAAMGDRLRRVQDRLFVLGAALADPAQRTNSPVLAQADVEQLEAWIDEASAALPKLTAFILPGGGELATRLHLARTTCRRAERLVVALSHAEDVGPQAIPFLNRLGDLLFAWARLANKLAGVEDVVWRPPADQGAGP